MKPLITLLALGAAAWLVRRVMRAAGPIVRCYQPGPRLVREAHAQ